MCAEIGRWSDPRNQAQILFLPFSLSSLSSNIALLGCPTGTLEIQTRRTAVSTGGPTLVKYGELRSQFDNAPLHGGTIVDRRAAARYALPCEGTASSKPASPSSGRRFHGWWLYLALDILGHKWRDFLASRHPLLLAVTEPPSLRNGQKAVRDSTYDPGKWQHAELHGWQKYDAEESVHVASIASVFNWNAHATPEKLPPQLSLTKDLWQGSAKGRLDRLEELVKHSMQTPSQARLLTSSSGEGSPSPMSEADGLPTPCNRSGLNLSLKSGHRGIILDAETLYERYHGPLSLFSLVQEFQCHTLGSLASPDVPEMPTHALVAAMTAQRLEALDLKYSSGSLPKDKSPLETPPKALFEASVGPYFDSVHPSLPIWTPEGLSRLMSILYNEQKEEKDDALILENKASTNSIERKDFSADDNARRSNLIGKRARLILVQAIIALYHFTPDVFDRLFGYALQLAKSIGLDQRNHLCSGQDALARAERANVSACLYILECSSAWNRSLTISFRISPDNMELLTKRIDPDCQDFLLRIQLASIEDQINAGLHSEAPALDDLTSVTLDEVLERDPTSISPEVQLGCRWCRILLNYFGTSTAQKLREHDKVMIFLHARHVLVSPPLALLKLSAHHLRHPNPDDLHRLQASAAILRSLGEQMEVNGSGEVSYARQMSSVADILSEMAGNISFHAHKTFDAVTPDPWAHALAIGMSLMV
ncbi:uncharacterized protein MYCFIDRAFT_177754 [Pseudocercospora fijiensis CIRAD86]|uniref:Transcription factor domain-containing protein n=1 Tax=Pseudocercospora fijiensis (strain CIRAD86) TaxID=383855 RepID=M2ZJ07_PSEFD|nr:uncharacterized protein MYCFIDRAFT_177754 [Pseudocercospora fijiensis CIRAD86]EME79089.1 hypothetical protein MYCFIDRAFT_177754 [Pseudocercospora fijiensis CIRAD86]